MAGHTAIALVLGLAAFLKVFLVADTCAGGEAGGKGEPVLEASVKPGAQQVHADPKCRARH